MSRTQVRDILGTPLLASVFHVDRWIMFLPSGVRAWSRRRPGHGFLQR